MDEEQIKLEIAHIFDSGVNEIRILELCKRIYSNGYDEGHADGYVARAVDETI